MENNNQYLSTNNENSNYGLDIVSVFESLWKHKILILVLATVVALASFVNAFFFTEYTYTVSGMVYISNKSEVPTTQTAVSANDIVISRALGETYKEILTTRSFYHKVSDDLNGEFSPSAISAMMSVEIINETELIRIRTTSVSPADAYKVSKSIFSNAQDTLRRVYPNGRIEVIDEPYFPQSPNARGTVRKTVIGFIFGAVLGVLCVFIRRLFDTKIRNGADILKRYGVSVLGEISGVALSGDKKRKKKKNNVSGNTAEHILSDSSSFDTIETYKFARTNIMFSIPKSDNGKVVVVTSAVPGDGKTTTSINLAITFAQTGAKVMLVDCDLRKASVHRYLGLEHPNGISNVLCGFSDIESATRKNVRENLDVLTVGEIPPNPAELLNSEEFGKVLSQLQEKYDYIFIDTPPMTVVTDASVVMKKAHGVVLVVRKNQTTFDMMNETVDGIEKANTKILGAVILDSEEKNKKYGYYKKSKYGYKYKNYAYGYGVDSDKK